MFYHQNIYPRSEFICYSCYICKLNFEYFFYNNTLYIFPDRSRKIHALEPEMNIRKNVSVPRYTYVETITIILIYEHWIRILHLIYRDDWYRQELYLQQQRIPPFLDNRDQIDSSIQGRRLWNHPTSISGYNGYYSFCWSKPSSSTIMIYH